MTTTKLISSFALILLAISPRCAADGYFGKADEKTATGYLIESALGQGFLKDMEVSGRLVFIDGPHEKGYDGPKLSFITEKITGGILPTPVIIACEGREFEIDDEIKRLVEKNKGSIETLSWAKFGPSPEFEVQVAELLKTQKSLLVTFKGSEIFKTMGTTHWDIDDLGWHVKHLFLIREIVSPKTPKK